MAVNDLWSLEMYYQVLEEILALNLWYIEVDNTDPAIAGRELAKAYVAKFDEVDRQGLFPTEFRMFGCRVNNYSNQSANPYEQNTVQLAEGAAVPTTDLLHASVNFLGRTTGGVPVQSAVQFSVIPLSAILGNQIIEDWASALEAWFNDMRILQGPNEGAWIHGMRHAVDPEVPGSGTPIVVEFYSVSNLVRTRLDRKPNTPNTGRSPNGNGEPAQRRVRRQRPKKIEQAAEK